VVVEAGRIVTIGSTRAGTADGLDGGGLLLAPGFVDLQCNGAVGIDLALEPDRLWEVAAALPRWGVTAWLPTIITSPPEITDRALATLAAGPAPGIGPVAWPLGLHLEGPFIAEARKGAHPTRHLRLPDRNRAATWSRQRGVALVTLAPELPGALDLVDDLVRRDVVVSLGHSAATAAEAAAAIDRGASMVTHLFNAMDPLGHRAPTLVAQALADERLSAGLIADGLHIDPTVVVGAWRALGHRLVLVTDAVGALGTPPGSRRLGDGIGEVTVGPDRVRLADGTLAGSILSMDAAVRNLAAWTRCGLAGAVAAATAAPAQVLGLADRGVVRRGAVADLVLLTADGEVVTTITAGRPAGP
jgi:N-acetylglucosamine-6-phosphate deacetylase